MLKSSNSDPSTLRVAVLISGSGSNLQALIDAIASQQLPGVEIVLVISNKADAYGLQRALKERLPAAFIPWKQRAETETLIAALLHLFQADLIVLAGWMRILSADFTTQFPQRIINLDPARDPMMAAIPIRRAMVRPSRPTRPACSATGA